MHEESTPPNVEPTSVDVHGTSPTPPNAPASAERVAIPLKVSRLKRLVWIFALLFAVLVVPSVAGRIQYALTAAKERAQYDFAREHLKDLNLTQNSNASSLLGKFVGPSVVNVRASRGRAEGQGSGVIVDAEGYIVTNYHVVDGVDTVEVQLSDGRRGDAIVIGRDELVDIAVLKTELDNLIPAEWGDSDELAVGEWVWAVGSPFGLQNSITFGIISAKERRGIRGMRDVRNRRNILYQEYLQTDAAVNPGNSGGPLVNTEGKVVGINTAIIGDTYQGISFSIPSTIARASYEQLRSNGWVQRGLLGVEPVKVTDSISRRLGLERDQGVLVWNVGKNTPADDAGIERYDVILSWDDVDYSDPMLMSQAIAATPIGSEVPVRIVRRGDNGPDHLTLTVTVAARPRDDSR